MQDIGQCGFVTTPPDVDEDVGERLRKSILRSLDTGTGTTISATDLHSSMTQNNPLNDPFLLDLRSPPRYQNGHIPGAINKDLDTMFKERDFSDLPTDGRTIVVIADSPQMSSQARAYLDILGYTATVLEYGMSSWTPDSDLAPVRYDRTMDCHNFPVSAGQQEGNWNTAGIAGQTREEILFEAAASLATLALPVMNATEIFTILNDNITGNDPVFISIQDPDTFQAGHIEQSPGNLGNLVPLLGVQVPLGHHAQRKALVVTRFFRKIFLDDFHSLRTLANLEECAPKLEAGILEGFAPRRASQFDCADNHLFKGGDCAGIVAALQHGIGTLHKGGDTHRSIILGKGGADHERGQQQENHYRTPV